MSFDGSLILFPPGEGAPLSVSELCRFCEHLCRELAIEEQQLEVCLKYAQPGESSATTWDERGEMGTFTDEQLFGETQWDHKREKAAWSLLWPEEPRRDQVVERAYIHCGNLPHTSSEEMTIRSEAFSTYPHAVTISLRPVVPMTLAGAEEEDNCCYGSLSVSFFGSGYFTWQPLAEYWRAVRASPFLARALAVCRSGLPGAAVENVEGIKAQLGALFLNRAEHQPGDWIVSVEESG